MLVLALLVQAAFGVADPTQRFVAVPVPITLRDPCVGGGPVGRWQKLAGEGAPPSIHDESWIDSAAGWRQEKVVVAVRRDGKWKGSALDVCDNAWSPITETATLALDEPWPSDGHDRPYQPGSRDGSYDAFEPLSIWDAARKAWVTVKAGGAPTPRAHYAVALAGARLFVWGGWGPKQTGLLGDGATLDVARPSWKRMSTQGAPSPRLAPTAVVWTGSRLLVWGGRAAAQAQGSLRVLGDGAAYDPATDRWTPMSVVNAPTARTEATVAWTGRRLVVLGGSTEPGGPPLPGGGVYDPATNTWTRLSPPPGGLELPRANIGPLTRIFVMADGRVVFLPNDLGRIAILDADHASWTTLAANEPGKRTSFRAFLAGRRLVVWGGLTVIAEHRCPPPVAGQPMCDPFAETAPHDDGWMLVLPAARGGP
jgi:hypothetical protein